MHPLSAQRQGYPRDLIWNEEVSPPISAGFFRCSKRCRGVFPAGAGFPAGAPFLSARFQTVGRDDLGAPYNRACYPAGALLFCSRRKAVGKDAFKEENLSQKGFPP